MTRVAPNIRPPKVSYRVLAIDHGSKVALVDASQDLGEVSRAILHFARRAPHPDLVAGRIDRSVAGNIQQGFGVLHYGPEGFYLAKSREWHARGPKPLPRAQAERVAARREAITAAAERRARSRSRYR